MKHNSNTDYLPRILPGRMPTVDLCQTVHASLRFCREICRQFVVYPQTTTAQSHSQQLWLLAKTRYHY